MRKSQFLSQAMKEKRKRARSKAFEQTQASLTTEQTLVLLRGEKFQPESDGKIPERLLACNVHKRYIYIDEK